MSKVSGFGIEFMNEIASAASKFGWTGEDLAKLFSSESNMKAVLRVLRGSHEVRAVDHFIDCNSTPQLLSSVVMKHEELEIAEHYKVGILNFDVDRVSLYVSPKQKTEEQLDTCALKQEFTGKLNLLNINVMEYLLANQAAIPYEWEDKYIFFWGTITEIKGWGQHVPHMYYSRRKTKWLHDYCPIATAQKLSEKDCAAVYTGYMKHYSESKK